jgi:glycosyltransferase involved in cell wall biosynthesis
MKLLLLHNYYQQPGGEDAVFEAEGKLLEGHGHTVLRHTVSNDTVPLIPRLTLARNTIWNPVVYRGILALLRHERPDVMHVHNTLPLLSPAVYYAARAAGVPVVQTLHNYRLLCPRATFYRDNRVCEDCLHAKLPTPSIRHQCYRGSRSASAVIAAMLTVHRVLGTWAGAVDLFIALSEFARGKLIEGALPAAKIMVKPNFTVDPGVRAAQGKYALFVGRLSEEKGIDTLLGAWKSLGALLPLRLIGDGPSAGVVEAAVRTETGLEWLGRRTPTDVVAAMAGARFLVFPSVWYEGFPLTIIEAYAVGLPVIASAHGTMTELVKHRQTGLHFRPGDIADLITQVRWALSHPDEMNEMGRRARQEYEAHYTPERNYELLMGAYDLATRIRRSSRARRGPSAPEAGSAATPGLVR